MKQKRSYQQMLTMAEAIVGGLQPACERIEIAGSLRRRKAEVGDIEIIAAPKLTLNLLGEPSNSTEVDALLSRWPVTLLKNGAKYKQFTLQGTSGQEYQVDLFLQPDPATWGVNFLLRTGSDDFAHRWVTPKLHGGYMPDGFSVKDARVWRQGAPLPTPEEEDVFDLWGMQWVAPQARA